MSIDRVSDRLAWLGGAELEVLRQAPSARMRFVQMAGVLLTTSGLAVLSMSFALHDGLQVSWLAAVPVGLMWGFIILNLDRFLVLSMSAARGTGQLLLMAAPRLLMAMVLAAVISTPLVLRVFSGDITTEVFTMQLERSAAQKKLEANSNEQHLVSQLAGEIAADHSVLAGNLQIRVGSPGLATANASVSRLQGQKAQDQASVDSALAAWRCELYGSGANCAGASNKPGPGPIAQQKQMEYQQALSALSAVSSQLQGALAAQKSAARGVSATQASTLAAEQSAARAQLPGLVKQFNTDTKELQQISAQGTADNRQGIGILTQMQALAALGAQSSTVESTHIAVALLFFLIEILPVMVKILLSLCPETPYEAIARARDDTLMDQARIQRAEQRLRAEDESRARTNVEADMRRREEELGKRANEHVARELTAIIDQQLRKWSLKVRGPAGVPAANGSPAGVPAANGSPASGTPASGAPAHAAAASLLAPAGAVASGATVNGTGAGGTAGPAETPFISLPDEDEL
jgi:Domain of unknown function (DUF4407)